LPSLDAPRSETVGINAIRALVATAALGIDTVDHQRSAAVLTPLDSHLSAAIGSMSADGLADLVVSLVPYWRWRCKAPFALDALTAIRRQARTPAAAASIEIGVAQCSRDLANLDLAAASAERALWLADQGDDAHLHCAAIVEICAVSLRAGVPLLGRDVIVSTTAQCRNHGWSSLAARLLAVTLLCDLSTGSASADTVASAGHELLSKVIVESIGARVALLLALSRHQVVAGDLPAALGLSLRAEATARVLGERSHPFATSVVNTARIRDDAGDHRVASRLLLGAADVFSQRGSARDVAIAHTYAGLALARAGDSQAARTSFQRAVRLGAEALTPLEQVDVVTSTALAPSLGLRPADRIALLGAVDQRVPGYLGRLPASWQSLHREVISDSQVAPVLIPSRSRKPQWTLDEAMEVVHRELHSLLQLPTRAASVGLSRREADVLRLVTHGLSDRQIAEELFIGIRTVNSHISAVLRKLGKTRRSDAAAWVHEDAELPESLNAIFPDFHSVVGCVSLLPPSATDGGSRSFI
jgi:DNA-binding CsgD family transcriptional regulator